MGQLLRCVPGAEPVETDASPSVAPPDELLDHAAKLGFELVSYQTDADQTVWEWRQGDGPRPQFVTERVARQWMADWLARQPELAEPQPLEDRRRTRGDDAGTSPTVAESA